MVIEALTGKLVGWLASNSAKDKTLAQEQLRPALERRFEPCLELWRNVWKWVDDFKRSASKGEDIVAFATDEKFAELAAVVDPAITAIGGLVSFECLQSLERLQKELRSAVKDDLHRQVKFGTVIRLIYPSGKKVDERADVALLLLLRDEIGSNIRSASSALG